MPVRPRWRRITTALLAGAVLTGCSTAAAGPTPTSSSATASDGGYGSWPSFLPSPSAAAGGMLTGSTATPALTAEGETVLAQLGADTVEVTVTGPEVPGEGLPYQGPTTTCTWTVTLAAATAAIPVRTADFFAVDHFGGTYALDVLPGQSPPPAVLQPGQTSTFEVRAVMKTGEGIVNWAPLNGRTVGTWDFVVEND